MDPRPTPTSPEPAHVPVPSTVPESQSRPARAAVSRPAVVVAVVAALAVLVGMVALVAGPRFDAVNAGADRKAAEFLAGDIASGADDRADLEERPTTAEDLRATVAEMTAAPDTVARVSGDDLVVEVRSARACVEVVDGRAAWHPGSC